MKRIFLATSIAISTGGCLTNQVSPKASIVFPSASPTVAGTATIAGTVGDISSDGNRNIVILDYSVKGITGPFASGWDADKVLAGLKNGTVRPYVAGSFLGGSGWMIAPQDQKYFGILSGSTLIVPIPSESDFDGGNVAFAVNESGVWKQVAWSSSTGPKNYLSVYDGSTKFHWIGWKLISTTPTITLVPITAPTVAPASTATPVPTTAPTPVPTPIQTPALPATSSTEVGDMSDNGSRSIVVQNYLAKAIVSPFANGWDAARTFAELSSGSVKPYVAGWFLGSPGWNGAPQNLGYYGSLSSGNLSVPIPTDTDLDGGNIAFAVLSGSTWTQIAWSSSQGPRNFLVFYGSETKFHWAGWKLTRR